MSGECTNGCNEYGEVYRLDPQAIPMGCYVFNNSSINDTFNGLATLNSPSRPGLTFTDPYTNQNMKIIGYCIKHCIDLKFDFVGVENGINCRCGNANALQSYIKVDDKICDKSCLTPTCKGNATYPCGGKNAYTVYKAEMIYYNSPHNITIEEKLNTMYNINKNKVEYPNYKGCIEEDRTCGKKLLSDWCLTTETMTVDECIDNCRKGNYKYAGLEARTQCFCGNSYDSGGVGRLLGSEACSASCPGNNSQICGGVWALSLYEVPLSISPINSPVPLIVSLSVGIPLLILSAIVIRNCKKRVPSNDDRDTSDHTHTSAGRLKIANC